MTWIPPKRLDELVTTTIVDHREEMSARQVRDRAALDANLAARGLLNGGARLSGYQKIDTDAFDAFAQGIVSDVLKLVRDVYGEIPIEAAPWIRRRIDEWLDGLASAIMANAKEMYQRAGINADPEPPRGPVMKARRRLDVELGTLELRATLKELTPPARPMAGTIGTVDAFICHASEDKTAVARPIADALVARGYRVWLDETELKVGDRLLDKIDDGLVNCRFGIVVISPSFFGKQWTRRELAGLVARQDAEDRTIILPVWYEVDQNTIAKHLPSLAGILAARMSDGLDKVVAEIVRTMGPPA